jgi:hypothetical protein
MMVDNHGNDTAHATALLVEVDSTGLPNTWQPSCECGWQGDVHGEAGLARAEALQHYPKGVGDRLIVSWPGKAEAVVPA